MPTPRSRRSVAEERGGKGAGQGELKRFLGRDGLSHVQRTITSETGCSSGKTVEVAGTAEDVCEVTPLSSSLDRDYRMR